jgi:DNA polymerase-3 subunit alpha
MNDFTHLHLHTQYSLLDGAILIDKLIPKAQEYGMKALAITDHGAMHGIVDFYNACKKAGIKPVIGCEAYISPTSRFHKEYSRGDTSNYHLILLAENNIGLQNLRTLMSKAQLEGFYMRPRIDKELLREHHEGIIALSACLGGEIPQKIMHSTYAEARDAALEYQEIMGKGNYFLEIQQNGIPEQLTVNTQLANISRETGIPLVATCDCHYLDKGDHESHTVLMCIQTATTISHPNRMETASEELYFKSPKEMYDAFAAHPEALENTVKIAERCNVEIEFGKLHLPSYAVPEGYTAESYFRYLAKKGLEERLEAVPAEKHDEYRNRLEMELDVIVLKGYDGYFLIVWDFINYARENGISVGPGRGSGAGSLVAYSMRITDIDPIVLNLLFERFINPERPSLPDFDIDFCIKRRDEVIKYVREKYGNDMVAQIVTFGRLSGRGVIRDVSRVLEIPLNVADKLAKMIPETPGMTLTNALSIDPSIAPAYEAVPEGKLLLRHALKLEGLLRQAGMHAAGVVIADKPLVDYVPLCRGKDKEVLAQYEKGLLEDLGLVKFDFLGLANLTIIDDALRRIKKECDPNFDIAKIPFDDKDVYEMLSNGDSTGVFQLESDGMRRLMKKLQPNVLEDIIALNALFRPGPIGSGMLDDFCDRKHGVQAISYPLPELEPILRETYGVILYQEQVMQIARTVAGYSLGAADILRRAMGKKDAKVMEQQESIFIDGSEKMNIPGARKLGYNVDRAREIFHLMEKFANYGFNKSHSAAYAVIAYQTAYLRCKYPAQFLAAAMSLDDVKLEKITPYIDDAQRLGINVNPPNINKSGLVFEHSEGTIWFGLQAIKNVGSIAAEQIIAERDKNGPYKSLYNLTSRVDLRTANKKVLESLIHAGAFDCFGKNRCQHLQVLEACIEQGGRKQKMREQGIMSIEQFLFDDEEEEEASEYYPDVEEMPDSALLALEKSVLSIYFTSHPVRAVAELAGGAFDSAEKVLEMPGDRPVKVLGLVKSVRKLLANKNNPKKKIENMASFILEDLTGTVEAVAFPRTYAEIMHLLEPESLVVVEGNWKRKDERASIEVQHVYPVADALEKYAKCFLLNLPLTGLDKGDAGRLFGIFQQNAGELPVILHLVRDDGYISEIKLKNTGVKPTETFLRQVAEHYGKSYAILTDESPEANEPFYKFEQFYIEEPECEAI